MSTSDVNLLLPRDCLVLWSIFAPRKTLQIRTVNINETRIYIRSRDSSVGIATGYGLDDREFWIRVPVGSRIFSTSSRPALGPTQPPIQWVPGAFSLGVKRRGRKADHSPPASVEIKKTWLYTSTPTYAFMAWCLINQVQGTTLPLPLFVLCKACPFGV
jgi:hypothetical protein